MIHKLHDKKYIAKRKRITQTIVGVVVFLVFAVSGLLVWSGKIFTTVGLPVWKAERAVDATLADSAHLVRTKASVFNENQKLQEENAKLVNSMLDYQIIARENQELKELLSRIPQPQSFVLGNILSKPNRSPYDTIIIDIGTDVSLAPGKLVFANALTPIGEISKVYPNASLVMLYSNPGQITDGILDGSNANVELIGRGGGNFEMTLPIELSADKGTMVLLPNNTTFILAVVEEVISVPTDPVKKVILRTPVNIQNLKWVQVRKD